MSTATISYDQTTEFVNQITDANGNTTNIASVSVTTGTPTASAPAGTLTNPYSNGFSNYTQVTVTGSGTPISYVSSYNSAMDAVARTDGQGRVTMSKAFNASSPDPFLPTSTTDGDGNVTQYVYDQYGNLHQRTSPRNP